MKILVFQQTGLPVSEGCGDVLEKLSQKAELQFVDTKGIMSGQIFPETISSTLTANIILWKSKTLFSLSLAQGGGLLHIGGMPFEKAMVCENGAWREVIRTLGDLRNHEGYGGLSMPNGIFFGSRLGFTSIFPRLMRTFYWIGSKPLIRRLWET